MECSEPIDVLSYKLGIYRVGSGGKESRTVFERMSYNGKMSIVKCVYLAILPPLIVIVIIIIIITTTTRNCIGSPILTASRRGSWSWSESGERH